jgi:hypothetical protein
MLAYQDNVLEPNEAEDLGRKIKESDFAAGLMQRIRTVLRKVRMNAPKLDGKGMGNDANTVSEYLDSALPQDRVGDFERICLESDAHLAEVAGCHQVLTLVLGKPADVPETLREKVYALGTAEKAAAATAVKKETKAAHATNGRAAQAARGPAEVPEYLRGGRQTSFWQMAGTVAIAFLIGALLLRMMGPFNSSHPVLALVRGQPAEQPANTTPATTNQPSTPAPAPTDDGSSNKAGGDSEANAPAPEVTPMPPVDPTPVDPPEATNTSPPPADPASEVPTPKPPIEPEPKPTPAATTPPPVPVPPAPAPAPEVIEVGRFLSDEDVLAYQPMDDGIWLRVPAGSVLNSGERLIALPAYRPQIGFASGVNVTLVGESSILLLPPAAEGASRLQLEFGRMLVATSGAAGAQIELELAGVKGVATLVDSDSTLAVSVKQFLLPGSDPETAPVIPVIELFTTRGRVTWHEAGAADGATIPANHVRIYAGADPPEVAGPFAVPEWIDAKSLAGPDREAAPVLERELAEPKPLNLSLAEACQHRQVNVRSLAARSLSLLGDHEPLVKELSDPKQYSYWAAGFAVLRSAVQRGPETAAAVKATLERLRPEQAADLDRLLWGFSPEQLNKDGGAALVEFLRSEHMDVRVLAFQNLVTITGAMEFYMPQKRPEDLKASIQAWRTRQMKGTITYRSPPSPLEPYKPLDKPPAGALDLSAPKGAVAPLPPLEP